MVVFLINGSRIHAALKDASDTVTNVLSSGCLFASDEDAATKVLTGV